MSGKYKAVGWNRQKKIYDTTIVGTVLSFVAVFGGVTLATHPGITVETVLLRTTALGAIIMLHLILCIGPLARLDSTFLPLLYNRRHLGITMFLLALVHAIFAIIQFHAMGPTNPLVSIFTAYKMEYTSGRVSDFPFEPFGFLALLIFMIMAVTSHDFWLKLLGAAFWKALHMAVYVAYGSLIVHVAYGVLQSEQSVVYPILLSAGFAIVVGLHLAAGLREHRLDKTGESAQDDGFVLACAVADLKEGCGQTVLINSTRRAVFLHSGKVYALSNVCRHQGGPISEGKILDGCITCPWHGWQYNPDSGVSPPPFHEVIETYPVRVENGAVYVHPNPNPLEQNTDGVAIPVEA
jgi:nitrite reductase/ring-hydroxylating ferredoxin subunit